MEKLPIYRLDIVEDLDSNVEVDFVALVDRPAIEKSFLAFQDSYSDYPDSVKNNAKKVLDWTQESPASLFHHKFGIIFGIDTCLCEGEKHLWIYGFCRHI